MKNIEDYEGIINIDRILFGDLPDRYTEIIREAGRDPSEFVYMEDETGTVVIWENPEAPTWEDILRQPLACSEENFSEFWWDLREEWAWIWESNFSIDQLTKVLSSGARGK